MKPRKYFYKKQNIQGNRQKEEYKQNNNQNLVRLLQKKKKLNIVQNNYITTNFVTNQTSIFCLVVSPLQWVHATPIKDTTFIFEFNGCE